jgi:hypothetical protein
MLTAHTSSTRSGSACCELHDGDKVVLKAYASADERKLRIALSELIGYKQTLVDPDSHWLEFSRSEDDALPNASRAPIAVARVKCSVPSCTELASFIIKRVAYCAEHRKVAR